MHELSICSEIIKQLAYHTKLNKLSELDTITLCIGALTCLNIDVLKYSFAIAAKDSIAEKAKLIINVEPGLGYCEQCLKEFPLNSLFECCPTCQGFQYQIKQGKITQIKSIEGR